MKKQVLIFLMILLSTTSWAAVSRTLDGQFITNGAATLTLPTTTDTMLGRATTDTLLNKSMSGASNTFTLIPVGAIGNGSVLSGSNTGDVTIGTANGLSLIGQALSLQLATGSVPGALSAADWTTFNGKQAAGNYITALTGDVAATGPGSSAATLATVNGNIGSFTNANITVNAKGLITAASNGTSASPVINGSQASPQAVTAAGGITLSGLAYDNIVFVTGSPGAVTVTATPSITICTTAGQRVQVIGESATNTVTLQDEAGLAGAKLQLNGTWVGGLNSVLNLVCDGNGFWVESSRR